MNAFEQSAEIYDDLYLPKRDSLRREAEEVVTIFGKFTQSGGNSPLDITCGTGIHLAFLREHACVGLFSHDDFVRAFSAASLDLMHDFRHPLQEDGSFDAYIGRRPKSK